MSNIRSKICLVTGGAGFIGSNLVDSLIEKGASKVICIDNESADSNSKFYWNNKAKNHKIDINNYEDLEEIFSFNKPDIVFHAAAEARIQPTIDQPQKACLSNFVGTCNILQACREFNSERLIYSSTSSAYGLKNTPPLTEDMPKDCLSPYSVSKTGGEELCKVYNSLYGVKTVTLRYFNVYGNRQPLKGPYAPVIGLFARQTKENNPMTIVGDGLQTRDFTHVQDVVRANILAALSEDDRIYGEIFNIGTGKAYSVLDIANMLGGDKIYIEARRGEARHTLADNSKAKKLLKWTPNEDLENYIKNDLI